VEDKASLTRGYPRSGDKSETVKRKLNTREKEVKEIIGFNLI